MLFNIYLKFEEQVKTPDGRPMSYQPRIWRMGFHQNIGYEISRSNGKPSIRARTRFCWLSEYPNSLNLEIDLDPSRLAQELQEIRWAIPGIEEIGFFTPNAQAEKGRPIHTQKADIIQFPMRLTA
jgi:hypothetical protein